MLLRQEDWPLVWSRSGCALAPCVLGILCPWRVGTQAQSCLPQLSAGSCLFPLSICLTPLGAVGADLRQPLVLRCPWSWEVPGEGAGFIQQMGRGPSLTLELGFGRFSFLARSWDEGCARELAVGVRSLPLGQRSF